METLWKGNCKWGTNSRLIMHMTHLLTRRRGGFYFFKLPIRGKIKKKTGDDVKLTLWEKTLEAISQKISKPSYDTWFKNTTAVVEDDVLTIMTENEFAKDWLEERYKTLIFFTIKEITGQTFEIEFSCPQSLSPIMEVEVQKERQQSLLSIVNQQNEILQKQQQRLDELEARIQALEDRTV